MTILLNKALNVAKIHNRNKRKLQNMRSVNTHPNISLYLTFHFLWCSNFLYKRQNLWMLSHLLSRKLLK